MACKRLVGPLTTQLQASRRIETIVRPAFASINTASFGTQARRRISEEMGSKAEKKVEAPNGEQVPEKDLWKYRAPYRVHESQEDFDVKCRGNCHCGKVQFELSRDTPLASKLCHCTTCQTQHGKECWQAESQDSVLTRSTAAPFQWAAIFHKEDINFKEGHHNLEWYDPTEKSIEHKLPCKVRCSYCHSPIMDEGRNMILMFPSLIHLDTQELKDKFKPRYKQPIVQCPSPSRY